MHSGSTVPVCGGSALESKCTNFLLEQIIALFPSCAGKKYPCKKADGSDGEIACDSSGSFAAQVFKTITVDNGSEFADFAQVENWGSKVFFAHPYTSWERPQNERHNGLFRAFVPKGASIEGFTDEDILAAADELNGRPRKKLGYCTPEELFEDFLDAVYAA